MVDFETEDKEKYKGKMVGLDTFLSKLEDFLGKEVWVSTNSESFGGILSHIGSDYIIHDELSGEKSYPKYIKIDAIDSIQGNEKEG